MARRTVGGLQLRVDPADQVTVGNVADEQEQGIGGLVQAPVSQNVLRQRTASDMIRLGAGPADLVVPAIMEVPVALELGTAGAAAELLLNVAPRRPAMPLHVIVGDLIRDALVAQTRHEPVEHGRRVVVPDRGPDPLGPEVCPDLIEQAWRPCQATNGMDQPHRMIDRRTFLVLRFWIFRVVSLMAALN